MRRPGRVREYGGYPLSRGLQRCGSRSSELWKINRLLRKQHEALRRAAVGSKGVCNVGQQRGEGGCVGVRPTIEYGICAENSSLERERPNRLCKAARGGNDNDGGPAERGALLEEFFCPPGVFDDDPAPPYRRERCRSRATRGTK